MGLIESMAFLTGVIAVWLTIRQNVWCWPIGLVNVSLVLVMAWRGRLLADAGLQVFFFLIQLYGWRAWTRGRPGEGTPSLRVSRAPGSVLWLALAFIAASTWGLGTLLQRHTDADFAYWDAAQAMMSVVAQWMIARKYLENWGLWIVVNVLTIGLYYAKHFYLLMVLYCIYLVLAVVGHFEWERSLGLRFRPRLVAAQCSAAGLAAFLSLAAWITWAGLDTELRRVDCIVVPGARVEADGRLGPSLQGRVERALELYREGWAPVLVFTGGPGASGPVEAECARAYAIARGIPESACFLESRSHNTMENFLYAREVMRRHGWESCLVTTDPFHSKRAVTMARQLGLEAYPAPSFLGPAWRRPGTFFYYTVREVGSWLKYGVERLHWSDPAPRSAPGAELSRRRCRVYSLPAWGRAGSSGSAPGAGWLQARQRSRHSSCPAG